MLYLIVAMDENKLIGNQNELPWYYPEDLKYFRKLTLHKAVIMGYNTYLSIIERNGKILPQRDNFVLTEEDELPNGGIVVTDLDAVLEAYKEREIFVIGGRSVYEQLLPIVERLYITRIPGTHEGDVYFPEYDENDFKQLGSVKEGKLVFEIYERIKK